MSSQKIRITGDKRQVQSSLLTMCRAVWAYQHMRHRAEGQYAYLAAQLQRGELYDTRIALRNAAHRASRWAGAL